MKKMLKRLNSQEGFTLAELLIVVAIIAVLVAVSIPVFNNQLEKSRDATSAANIRSAYAMAQASYLSEVASDKTVTVNKTTDGKVGSVVVSGVKFEGVQPGWSGAITDLPQGVVWDALGDDASGALGGQAGNKTLTFTYNNDGTITLSVGTGS